MKPIESSILYLANRNRLDHVIRLTIIIITIIILDIVDEDGRSREIGSNYPIFPFPFSKRIFNSIDKKKNEGEA